MSNVSFSAGDIYPTSSVFIDDGHTAGEAITPFQPIRFDGETAYVASVTSVVNAEIAGISVATAAEGQPIPVATSGTINVASASLLSGVTYGISPDVGYFAPLGDLGVNDYVSIGGTANGTSLFDVAPFASDGTYNEDAVLQEDVFDGYWQDYFSVMPHTIRLAGTPGERLHAQFTVKARGDINRAVVTVSCAADESWVDLRAVKTWYQAGRSYGKTDPPEKHFNRELLLYDPMLVQNNLTTEESSLKDTSEDLHVITGADATLPDNLEIEDAATLQSMDLNQNESQDYWITVTAPTAAGEHTATISVTGDSKTIEIDLVVRVAGVTLEDNPGKVGIYYLGRYDSGDPTPSLKEPYYISEARMAVELQDIYDHGFTHIAQYGTISVGDAPIIVTKMAAAGFDTDELFFVIYRYDTIEATVRSRCQALLAEFPDADCYLYGEEETADQTQWREEIGYVHDEDCFVWNAFPTDSVDQVADIQDIGLSSSTADSDFADALQAYGNEAYNYGNPHIQDVKHWVHRRNYGWRLWQENYDGMFIFAYRKTTASGHPWLDWDSSLAYRHMVLAYPTTSGIVGTIQWERLSQAITDRRYIATLEAAIAAAPASLATTAAEAQAWLDARAVDTMDDSLNSGLEEYRLTMLQYCEMLL